MLEVEWTDKVLAALTSLDRLDSRRAEQISEMSDDITQVWKELAELRDEVHALARLRVVK